MKETTNNKFFVNVGKGNIWTILIGVNVSFTVENTVEFL